MTGVAAAASPAKRHRYPTATVIGLFVVATLVFTWAFAAFLQLHPSSDLVSHLAYARRLHSLADVTSPHLLFELLVRAGVAIGFSYQTAAVWLLGACYGGMAALIGYEMQQRGIESTPLRTFLVVMSILLASHIFLVTLQSNLYRGYFVPTAYHSPTQQLNKLFAVAIYFAYARQFLGAGRARWSAVPLMAVLCVLSALAKPSFLIAFLPAAALYAAHDLVRRRWRQALLCLAGIGLPSALTALWQTQFLDAAGQSVETAFRPFVVFDASETAYKLPLSLAFPLVVAAGAWWTQSSEARLRFIWTLTAVALFVTLCIVESGSRMMHGNFAWTGQTGVFLVYVESLLFLLTQPQRAWTRAAWIVFGLHVVSGLYWYGLVFEEDWRHVV
jgi:hypothetical protein